jgi:hypothetical protein
MINCNFHVEGDCQLCKYYNECELTLPFTKKSYNSLKEIREEIKDLFKEWKNNKLSKVELFEIKNEIRILRNKEFIVLNQLRIKRDRG